MITSRKTGLKRGRGHSPSYLFMNGTELVHIRAVFRHASTYTNVSVARHVSHCIVDTKYVF